MSIRIYLSGNTINCYDNFALVCTKDFDNTYFTDNYSLVDDEEYFDAEFESIEVLEDSYESKIEELNDKVADLEAKLAESEKYNAWVLEFLEKCKIDTNSTAEYSQNPIIEYLEQVSDFRAVECEELKQQLAEKEELKLRIKKLEKLYSEALETVDSLFTNQDKISFCIEQLEKVKEFCNQREKDFTYLRDEIKAISHNKWVDYIEELRFIKCHIDNQIASLKKGVE